MCQTDERTDRQTSCHGIVGIYVENRAVNITEGKKFRLLRSVRQKPQVVRILSKSEIKQPDNVVKKVKERIVFREIHLRTTGRHLSMGSHSVICHP